MMDWDNTRIVFTKRTLIEFLRYVSNCYNTSETAEPETGQIHGNDGRHQLPQHPEVAQYDRVPSIPRTSSCHPDAQSTQPLASSRKMPPHSPLPQMRLLPPPPPRRSQVRPCKRSAPRPADLRCRRVRICLGLRRLQTHQTRAYRTRRRHARHLRALRQRRRPRRRATAPPAGSR